MKNNNVCFLVSSYFGAVDIWPYFIELYHKYKSNVELTRYIGVAGNIDSKDFDIDLKGFKILNVGPDISWCDNLLAMLNLIEEEYVILLLDDFFFYNHLKENLLESYYKLMEKEQEINGIYLHEHNTDENWIKNSKMFGEDSGLVALKNNVPYHINLQACLWRKSFLKRLCLDGLNAWEFEAFHSRFSQKIDFNVYYSSKPVLFYKHAIEKGKWLEQGKSILNENNISLDFNVRGNFEIVNSLKTEKNFNWKDLIPRFLIMKYIDFKRRAFFKQLKSS